MPEYNPFYLLISGSFVLYVDLFVVGALWLLFRRSKKHYLAFALCGGLVEPIRQLPDNLLIFYPESLPLYQLSFFLQFAATSLFLGALLQITTMRRKIRQLLLGVPISAYLLSSVTLQLRGMPEAGLEWYLYVGPTLLLTSILVWTAAHVGSGWEPSRVLLAGTSLTLLVMRAWVTGVQPGDVFYLLSYMEHLIFPMMLAAMLVLEAELTNQQVTALLEQRTHSGEDLQFIVDNSDDVILIANEVGLVQTWSLVAEKKFGYNAEQAINKLHMDDLFAQITFGKSKIGSAEFRTKMEGKDGRWFKASVSMKTIARRDHVYNIYVLKDIVEAV